MMTVLICFDLTADVAEVNSSVTSRVTNTDNHYSLASVAVRVSEHNILSRLNDAMQQVLPQMMRVNYLNLTSFKYAASELSSFSVLKIEQHVIQLKRRQKSQENSTVTPKCRFNFTDKSR